MKFFMLCLLLSNTSVYAVPHIGEVIFKEQGCMSCHARNGEGSEDVPSLNDKDGSLLTKTILDSRSGDQAVQCKQLLRDGLEGKEESIAIWLTLIANQDIE
jgi:mono/diheme cytochrome c family protein